MELRKQMRIISFSDEDWKKARCDRVDAAAQLAIAIFGGSKRIMSRTSDRVGWLCI